MSESISTYDVVGMTCDHCVMSVTEEVSEVAGVSQVDVELGSGKLTVTSNPAVDTAQIRAAVEEAGFELAAS